MRRLSVRAGTNAAMRVATGSTLFSPDSTVSTPRGGVYHIGIPMSVDEKEKRLKREKKEKRFLNLNDELFSRFAFLSR